MQHCCQLLFKNSPSDQYFFLEEQPPGSDGENAIPCVCTGQFQPSVRGGVGPGLVGILWDLLLSLTGQEQVTATSFSGQ